VAPDGRQVDVHPVTLDERGDGQMRVHSGYEFAAKDHDEVRDLQKRFGVDPPEGYQRPQTPS
jgi:hypothetical protein